MHLYFPVYILFLALPICAWSAINSFGPRKSKNLLVVVDILSKDCNSMPTALVGLEELQTKTLRIDDLEDGVVIYSHDFESDSGSNVSSATVLGHNYYAQYPLSFACEVVIHAPIENGRIMLSIESFFIPSSDQTCKDDFLYVFDSNTARSKAMPEAGGEQGLCLSRYPKMPVLSSKSYICIAFRSSNSPQSQLPSNAAAAPGFKITVTAFQERNILCQAFHHSRMGIRDLLPIVAIKVSHLPPDPRAVENRLGSEDQILSPNWFNCAVCYAENMGEMGLGGNWQGQNYACPQGRFYCGNIATVAASTGASNVLDFNRGGGSAVRLPSMGICVSERVRCDGVVNCPDGRDESPSLCSRFQDSDKGFFNPFLTLGLTTTIALVITGTLFVVLCLGCVVCYCCFRKRSNLGGPNSPNTVGITVFNGANRPISDELGGQQVDPSTLLNGMHKSPEAFQSQMLQHQQQMMITPGKSMGDLYHHQQVSSNAPILRQFQNQQSHPNPGVWNMQPVCCPPPPTQPHQPQWYPQQQQLPMQNNRPMAMQPQNKSPLPPHCRISDPKVNRPTADSRCFIGSPSPANVLPCPPAPASTQQQVSSTSSQKSPLHSTRFDNFQHLNSPDNAHLVADGGIVYLGEIGGGTGSGSGGSHLTGSRDHRRPRRRSGRTVDTQSSSSFGGGPSTRGAQSAEGAPRTASNSSHSIGPSWSSSRGTAANNPNNANSNSAVRPHYHHHHHRRRRHGGAGGGGMRSDVPIVLLSLQVLVQGGLLGDIFNGRQKQNENQVESIDSRLPVSFQDVLKAPRQMPGSKSGNKIAKVLKDGKGVLIYLSLIIYPYFSPVDDISWNEKVWAYVDSPQNLIPIPRAPTPTFGQVVPKPQVWHKDEVFFKLSPAFNISINGPSNYILKKAVSRYDRLTKSCSRLSTFSRFSVPRSISDEEIDENLHDVSRLNIKFPPRKLATHLYGPDASEFTLFPPCPNHKPHSLAIECLQIAVKSLGHFWPSAEMNESYSLVVDSDGVKIIAKEVWGAIRALETFSQLLWCSPSGYSIFINRTFINDFPTFSHRGLHLDTARHFISKHTILVNLEAMAFSKFNVFHWHLVDDQSFPFASKTFPELHKKAAYHPKMVYTHADIKEIIEFARVRGIRVIPEFDIPGKYLKVSFKSTYHLFEKQFNQVRNSTDQGVETGSKRDGRRVYVCLFNYSICTGHTRSWAYSHPELFVKCYESDSESPYYGGLDPTKEATLDLLVKLFKEIIELFPESYLHMGFDEVEFNCLETNPHIQNYLSEHQLQTSLDAIKLFTVRLLNSIQVLAKNSSMTGGKKFIFWQEAFESGLKLPSNSVIHQWKDLFSSPGYLGFPSIISKGWYLDSYFYPSEWIKYYENNLFPTQDLGDTFNKNRSKNVLGGEACMWNEWQSDETVIQRIWPVICAIAERLWNHNSPDTDEFAPRLEEMRCRLLRRGVRVGVTGGPGMCPLPLNADINPPRVFLNEYVDDFPFVIGQKANLLDFGSTNLIIFFGVVVFTFGYITSKLNLCSRFQRALKRLFHGILRFKIRKAWSFQCRNALCLVLPVCFFIFMGLLLLFSANVSRVGSNPKPVD
ncbi:unnamed protein product [Rodentolepis nana]|uniref:beta-N-acetylhexosaminidase n=1 Tax=Rodentolepis nana TaxID=102285 RepID=A0A158QHP7_RODNA|nr:unnamed protein product [Rodentolepis nana]